MEESKSDDSVTNSNNLHESRDLEIAARLVVSFHYRRSEVGEDGSRSDCLEQSFDGEPIYYLHGFGNIIAGLEQALTGKSAGDKIEITLQPQDAYGECQPDRQQRVPIKHLQLPLAQKKLLPGMMVQVQTDKGVRQATVVKAGKFNADCDFNHPLAGRTLHFEVEIMSVRKATEEEIAHRHVHGPGGHQH